MTFSAVFSYSAVITPAWFVVICENPGPAVRAQQTFPCMATPIIMSSGLFVETEITVFVPYPFPELGREMFESKGLFTFAPVMPKTINPLYSPPNSGL